jgi:hypothetical protein
MAVDLSAIFRRATIQVWLSQPLIQIEETVGTADRIRSFTDDERFATVHCKFKSLGEYISRGT